MADHSDFDFDFDVERSEQGREGRDDENGDFGDEVESPPAGDRARGGGLAPPEELGAPNGGNGRSGRKNGKRNGKRRNGERSIAGLTLPKLGGKRNGSGKRSGKRNGAGADDSADSPGNGRRTGFDDVPLDVKLPKVAPPEPEIGPEPDVGLGEVPIKRELPDIDAPDAGDAPGVPEPPQPESEKAQALNALRPSEDPESLDDFLDRSERSDRRPGIGRVRLPEVPDLNEVGEKVSEVGERVKNLRNFRVSDYIERSDRQGGGPPRIRIKLPRPAGGDDGRRKKGRVKTGRVLIIVIGLALLAGVSTVFGMMMAVANDLPNLENRTQYNASQNSVVYDFKGKKIGTLQPNDKRILVESDDIAESMKQAAVALEDQRFYEHEGVDFMGIGRAVVADVIPGGSTQGASTITMQFVKNALEAQGDRTPFQKLREASLAYHLERQWDKEKILTQYLNTIYFGEGAYGVEAAARTYFGYSHPGCGEDGEQKCASLLFPEESALLAGIISAPSAFSPRLNPTDALDRRNLVLGKMQEQGYLTETEYQDAVATELPSAGLIQTPEEDSVSPYFTSWLRQVLVDRYGAGRAFGGGLRVRTSLDLDLQEAAESAVYGTLSGIIPTGAAVVIDRKTGAIRAMVGGNDFEEHPFNLATQGHRQPGSSFKPFTLATAFENGHTSGETFSSAQLTYTVPNSGGGETFELHNYDDIYYGALDLASATIKSDNNVFMQLGYNIVNNPDWKDSRNAQESFNRIEETANKMGIDTDVTGDLRANPAMVLGGLIQGVTPLEMAFAFNTINNEGERITGTGASYKGGPVAMLEIKDKDGQTVEENEAKKNRAISEESGSEVRAILGGVMGSGGTGKRANTSIDGEFGKTGTTDDNGDAWFCGGTPDMTACVWVGHPQTNTPMETEFAGEPVDGGTFPALIWAQIVNAYYNIQSAREAGVDDVSTSGGSVSSGTSVAPSTDGGGGDGGGGDGNAAPAPAPPVGGGGGTGGGVGAGL